jgi:hypothetical protein
VVEIGVVQLFGFYGVPAPEALSVTLAWRAVEFVVALPGILLWADLVRSPEAKDALAVRGAAAAAPPGPPGGRGGRGRAEGALAAGERAEA